MSELIRNADGFSTIEEAIDEIRAGRVVIVVDDADRENEGDFIMAAEKVTPEAINFMATHGRGIVCMPCEAARLDELLIPLMVSSKLGSHETAFAVSIDTCSRFGLRTEASSSGQATPRRPWTSPSSPVCSRPG